MVEINDRVVVFENDDFLLDWQRIESSDHPKTALLKQVHGSDGTAQINFETRFEGDWHFTECAWLPLGILVADCTAIMIRGERRGKKVIAGIHAGWRGTAKRIIEKSLEALNLDHFNIWLSPSICQKHFEVGPEVLEALGVHSRDFAIPSGNKKFLLDLKSYQIRILETYSKNIEVDRRCTYCDPNLVSYRRARGNLLERHLARLIIKK